MSGRTAPPATLWGRADLMLLWGAVGVGLLLLAAGYWSVSGTRVFDDQVSGARLAGAGVLAAQAGFVVAVMRGRRALTRRLRAVWAAASEAVPPTPVLRPAPNARSVPLPGGRHAKVVAGGGLFPDLERALDQIDHGVRHPDGGGFTTTYGRFGT